MRQGLPWYKREPHAFLNGIQGLGPAAIGAYAVILDLLYARDGDTPRDDRHLSGILGCSVRLARALTDQLVEAGKIEIIDGHIVNSRVENDVKHRRTIRETLVNAGRMGGEKSGEVRRNKALAEANGSFSNEADKIREESVVPSPTVAPRMTKGSPSPTDVRFEFERAWRAYPRKVAKAEAEKQWRLLRREFPYDAIAGPLAQFIRAVNGTELTKIPHMRTWLHQRRFLDDTQAHGANREESPAERGSRTFAGFDDAMNRMGRNGHGHAIRGKDQDDRSLDQPGLRLLGTADCAEGHER